MNDLGLLEEIGLALLERDRVDDRLALGAAETGLDDGKVGRVDHEGDLGNVGLGGDEVDKLGHGRDTVEKTLVHVDIDDLGAVLDLLAGDREGLVVLAVEDELGKPILFI